MHRAPFPMETSGLEAPPPWLPRRCPLVAVPLAPLCPDRPLVSHARASGPHSGAAWRVVAGCGRLETDPNSLSAAWDGQRRAKGQPTPRCAGDGRRPQAPPGREPPLLEQLGGRPVRGHRRALSRPDATCSLPSLPVSPNLHPGVTRQQASGRHQRCRTSTLLF